MQEGGTGEYFGVEHRLVQRRLILTRASIEISPPCNELLSQSNDIDGVTLLAKIVEGGGVIVIANVDVDVLKSDQVEQNLIFDQRVLTHRMKDVATARGELIDVDLVLVVLVVFEQLIDHDDVVFQTGEGERSVLETI